MAPEIIQRTAVTVDSGIRRAEAPDQGRVNLCLKNHHVMQIRGAAKSSTDM